MPVLQTHAFGSRQKGRPKAPCQGIRPWDPRHAPARLLLLALFVLTLLPMQARSYAYETIEPGVPVVVSMGDSYSSGEGTEPFYGQDGPNKQSDADWLAHRSQVAWPGRLVVSGCLLSDYKDDNWQFTAISGATTNTITTDGQTKAWKEKIPFGERTGSKEFGPQIEVFSDKALAGKVDYVTISIGGNDLDFVGIMSEAGTSFVSTGALQAHILEKVTYYTSTLRPKILPDTYHALLDQAGDQATLVVAGYPRLLYRQSGDLLFSAEEAKIVDDAVDVFDRETSRLINELNDERIVFADVRSEFLNHEAYAPDSYINPAMFTAQAQDLDQTLGLTDASSYSFHPNDKGQAAYARVVQRVIDNVEARKAAQQAAAAAGGQQGGGALDRESLSASMAMALVLDASGSMDDPSGFGGMSKLDSAKRQTLDFVGATERQVAGGTVSASMGVSAFSSNSWTTCPLTGDLASVRAGINDIQASNMTNMYAGLEEGIRQLGAAPAESKILVFLSDGLNNYGLGSEDVVALAKDAGNAGIRIFTIGFGPEGDLDEQLLRQIAEATGGAYAHEDATGLSAATVGLFGTLLQTQLSTVGNVVLSEVGSVRQGELAKVGTFSVGQASDLELYLYWPGSQLDLRITDPEGTLVEEGYAGYTIDASAIPTAVRIAGAKPGDWGVEVYGAEVSMEEEPFYAAVSARETQEAPVAVGGGGGATNHGEGLLFLLVVVALASILGVYALSVRRGAN